MKKLFAVFILFLCVFSCVGCAKQGSLPNTIIGFGLHVTPEGSIVQELEFSAQTKILQKQKINALDVFETRKVLMRNVNKIREEYYISFLIRYSHAPNQQYKFGKGISITKTTYVEEYDVVSFSIIFSGQDAFNFYHPSSSSPTEGNLIKPTNPFLVKSVSVGQFPFSAPLEIEGQKITLGERYLKIYNSSFSSVFGEGYEKLIEPAMFVYDYGANYSRMRSDADYDFFSGGINHHIWIKSAEQLDNATIKISVAIANKGLWQLTFIAIIIAGTTLIVVYFYIKDNKNKKNIVSEKPKIYLSDRENLKKKCDEKQDDKNKCDKKQDDKNKCDNKKSDKNKCDNKCKR